MGRRQFDVDCECGGVAAKTLRSHAEHVDGIGQFAFELGAFGIEWSDKREQWNEALDAITRMFVEKPFAGHDGRFLSRYRCTPSKTSSRFWLCTVEASANTPVVRWGFSSLTFSCG